MRRFLAMLSLAALGAGALAGAALAKEGGLELASLPVGYEAGDPWRTTILLHGDVPVDDPGLRIHHVETGRALIFTAQPTQNPHVYPVEVGFPDWPAVGGGLGLALPAAAGAALFRRRRGGH